MIIIMRSSRREWVRLVVPVKPMHGWGGGVWLEKRLSRRVIRVIGWKGADGEGNVDRNIIILYIPLSADNG